MRDLEKGPTLRSIHFVAADHYDDAMSSSNASDPRIRDFITRWQASGAAERANYQLFLTELCDVLGVPNPEPTRPKVEDNAYVFERDVTFQNLDGTTSTGRIDLYKRGCFVLEAKQGSQQPTESEVQDAELLVAPKKQKRGTAVRGTRGWDDAMFKARGQAEQYARALPSDEGWPPFLIVVDVGHTIELFADFTRSGKTYLPFPDPGSFRIRLEKLADEAPQARLKAVWTDPLSLDPSRRSAKVTRELAERLARLAKSLEGAKDEHGKPLLPARVAQFLMRCLFTMFAEDVDLLPRGSFTELLKSLRSDIATIPQMLRSLWESMNTGGFSPILRTKLRWFNGGLFEDCEALPLREAQLDLLIEASQANWREVEPAIFGTLLERALDPIERHKLGAHYTPRAYVERLVLPTIVEPLREEWDAVRAAAVTLAKRGEKEEAIQTVRDFHIQLCETNILDPACGSGNFLYVAMEHLKRLEGEVLTTLRDFGFQQIELRTVNPEHFHGIEVNPRAAAIADLVLWIGYLQWHLRTRDLSQIREPIIQKYRNIECRDAVLAWDSVEEVRDEQGRTVTRWEGRTTKRHPVTGEQVPDDTARVPVLKYVNPRKAEWPHADYIIGNPPFVGGWKLRTDLGDGYVDALWTVFGNKLPNKADYVMYWWFNAARLVATSKANRFGFITTNSITMEFNRRIVREFIGSDGPITLCFAVPDHPWVDAADGADVRISITVAEKRTQTNHGTLATIVPIDPSKHAARGDEFITRRGVIQANLTLGIDLDDTVELSSNQSLSYAGVKLHGSGFIVDPTERTCLVKSQEQQVFIRPYLNGRDFMQNSRSHFVIDLFGLTVDEARMRCPQILERVITHVKPERDENRDSRIRAEWWIHGRPRAEMREAVRGLSRFIATPETSKHRVFAFLDAVVLPDNKLITVCSDDAFLLGVLSSRVHYVWATAMGGRLGVGNDPVYQNLRCFNRFAFPVGSDSTNSRIRELGEQLDAHRKRQQAAYPGLTMTGMYNVLQKLRAGDPLSAKEQAIHEQGLVSVLQQLHDELDAAVFDAYGWNHDLTDEHILERLVSLNAERATEERQGLIRWLRPEFQNSAAAKQQTLVLPELDEEESETTTTQRAIKTIKRASAAKIPWPKALPGQIQEVRQLLLAAAQPVSAAELARLFMRGSADRIEEVLQSLVITGNARQLRGGRYVSA